MRHEELSSSGCLAHSKSPLGTKWQLIIIYTLRERTMRFGQLAAVIGSISRKVLSDTLKDLEKEGLISREVESEWPLKVNYRLTQKGLALLPILTQLADWNKKQ